MTVVMVTHERALAERCAQRLIFLADGKLVGDESNSTVAAGVKTDHVSADGGCA
jgi:ABC-type polar amino acid transport system ATPase subunit